MPRLPSANCVRLLCRGCDPDVKVVLDIDRERSREQARLRLRSLRGQVHSVVRPGRRSGGWRQYVGAFIRRCAVGVDHQVLVALVDGLQRRASRDVKDPAGRDDLALGRLAEVHRQPPREDDEGLLLPAVDVAAAPCAGLVAPHISPSVLEVHRSLQLGNVPRGLLRLVRAGLPLKLLGQHDGKRHADHVIEVVGRDDSQLPDPSLSAGM